MMAAERVGDMTLDELKHLIAQTVVDRMRQVQAWPRAADQRSLQEILDSIDRNRWTPPPGARTSLELLREDRDQ